MGNEEMLIIKNKRASLVELPGKPHPDTKKPHVYWKTCEDLELIAGKKLLPGENNVPPEYWEAIKGLRIVKMFQAAGILKKKGFGVAKSLGDGLDSLEKHEALLKIHKCSVVQVLNDWADKTKDDSLKKACKNRIEELIEDQDKKVKE